MKNKILLIIVILLAVIYFFIRSFNEETSFFVNDTNVTIKNMTNNELQTMNIEEYLVGVIAGEMPASFKEEALKAQSIASRTYAYYKISQNNADYDLTTDKNSQVYLNKKEMQEKWGVDYEFYFNKIKNIIDETKGLILTYDNEIIPAYYFAMSNGYTENGKTVFGEEGNYLQTVVSSEDKSNRNYEVVKTIVKSDFCNLLNITCESITISDIVRNEANRVSTIKINNVLYSGIEIRKLLNLRSTDFTIEIADSDVYITTHGYGHGVGMSQYGANTMAKNGATYEEILKHYYTGVKIEHISSIK